MSFWSILWSKRTSYHSTKPLIYNQFSNCKRHFPILGWSFEATTLSVLPSIALKKCLFLQKHFANLFELLTYILRSIRKKYGCSTIPPTPCLVLLNIQTTRRQENFRCNVVCNPVKSTFQSPSGPSQNKMQHMMDPRLDLLFGSF